MEKELELEHEDNKQYNIFIIGSRAKGDNRIDSDINILISASISEAKYTPIEIEHIINDLNIYGKKNGGFLDIYQDDGLDLWSLYEKETKCILVGSHPNKDEIWNKICTEAKEITPKTIKDLCESVSLENKKVSKPKI
jgi:predicted nucleotidyltransferase